MRDGEAASGRRYLGRVMLVVAFLLGTAAGATAIEGLPGSLWGTLTDSSSDLSGSGGMGWINQGIDWTTLPGGIVVNTFVEYRYRDRSRNFDYYSAKGPAVGLVLKKGPFQLGTDYYWEHLPNYPGGPKRSSSGEVYLLGYQEWDLAKAADLHLPGAIGLPGAVWFNLFHSVDGLTGSGGMGWINQGIDWFTLPGGITFATYAEYRYRSRSKLEDYYDERGPVVGLEFKRSPFRLGANYYWQYAPVLKERSSETEVYLTLYIDWDLLKVGK